VGSLSYDVDERVLREYFGELGLEQVRLMVDHETGRPKGNRLSGYFVGRSSFSVISPYRHSYSLVRIRLFAL